MSVEPYQNCYQTHKLGIMQVERITTSKNRTQNVQNVYCFKNNEAKQ